MKDYVKPESNYIQLRAEEGISCFASIEVDTSKSCNMYMGWKPNNGFNFNAIFNWFLGYGFGRKKKH